MKYNMNRNVKSLILLSILVAVALFVAFLTTIYTPQPPFQKMLEQRRWPPPIEEHPPPGDIELFYTVNMVISTVNITLLVFLLITYIDLYRKTKSDFTIGLMVFSVILLLYALSSNPIIHRIFGFRAFGLGPFAMLPDLFTLGALTVLIYLTFKY